VYGDAEQFLGKWIKGRGVRDEVMILGKGAHTPCCDPQHMSEELTYSLNELQTSYVDIYMLHRDNPEIPVGEFMDALNAEKDAGRMRAFGAANWTIERYEAANAYAREKGLTGFIGISNQFSVCDMLDEPWPGCLRSSSPEFRAWHEKTQTPLFAWASIAQGFQVAGLYRPEDRDANPFMARVWFSKENFAKRDRAIELAKKKGVSEVSVAIAYVLAQPFPVFALTGYEKPSEIREGLAALDISLTREEIAWLDRG
jgi:aryl-alcohol dehydrogenase-like predicted oxidoreductase